MKRIIRFFCMFLLSMTALAASAQATGDSVYIYHKDGATVDKYSIKDIVKIAHSTTNMEIYTTLLGETTYWDNPSVSDIDHVAFVFDKDKYITVDIEGLTIADKNATTATKILYAYFKYYYGKDIVSATMANVNWNIAGAEHEKNVTGKYPAITCFDFIHIPFDGNWIKYSDITPVTSWADGGGVVSLMWHFNVPANEDDFNNKNYGNVTYSPDKTTWNMDNIYTDGSWENKWFYDQMDKVGAIMLKLQDAGVVALWRPFHEASGNMLNKKGWTKAAWFWWGSKGGDAYIKLWKTMKDYFEDKGIHNLIWVWTGTAETSDVEADTSYYPGDDNVDIVGCDCYGFTTAQLKAQFDGLTALYPGKMITLAECGNLTTDNGSSTSITTSMAKMSETWNAGAKFLYFMPWYDYYYVNDKSTTNSMFPDSYWTDAMNMNVMINHDNWRKK